MDSIQFSDFSTTGVNNSDTFDTWRLKTNGIVSELSTIKNDISPLFYTTGQNTSALLRTVTLDTPQTITGAKTFSGGTSSDPALKIDNAGLYYDSSANALASTLPLKSQKLIAQSSIQLGNFDYSVPTSNPVPISILQKNGNALSWNSLDSIIDQIQQESAASVVTTNVVLPVGSLVEYAPSTSIPTDWLPCNGSTFKGEDYPELATVLLDTYGTIYTDEAGTTPAPTVTYNASWWYALPDQDDKIIKAIPDSVVNTYISEGNSIDILNSSDVAQPSVSLTSGGNFSLDLRYDSSLNIDSTTRQLGIAPLSINTEKIISGSVTPDKLSFGGPSWDATTGTLFEGNDSATRRRVATREYVDSKIFKTGPVQKLASKISATPYSSAPGFNEFCYINHDGVPVVMGQTRNSRFGPTTIDKYSHTELPLPDNRQAVELHVGDTYLCALDSVGELWMIGDNTSNMFNIVPNPGATQSTWTKAYTPLYAYSTNNKISKIILSGNVNSRNIAIIDTSNRLWISGDNQYGALGRTGGATSTISAGEIAPILENVINAILIGNYVGANYATCVALTANAIHMAGYGGLGQNGSGNNNTSNTAFNQLTLSGIIEYSSCEIYGAGDSQNTTIFVKTPDNKVWGWGYNGNSILGDGTTTNKNVPKIISENPDFNIDKIYTTTHYNKSSSIYIYGQKNNAILQRGALLESTIANDYFGNSISSNDNGNIIAVGSPGNNGKVLTYSYNGSVWNQLGNTLVALDSASKFGESVSLNSSGTRLCVGIPEGNLVGSTRTGEVRVYDYINNVWVQNGTSYKGDTNVNAKLGSVVALSGDGTTYIAGAPGYNSNVGRVYVRRITSSGTITVGDPITGTTGQNCGIKVAINTTGDIIAVGSNGNSVAGVVRVYKLESGAWTQLGGDITGRAANDKAYNISLDGSGSLLAIGSPFSDLAGGDSGTTRVYRYNSQNLAWEQVGENINGLTAGEQCGSAVSLSRDGNTLAVSSINGDFDGKTDCGIVRIFKYLNSKWQLITGVISGTSGSEKWGGALALSADGLNLISSSPLWTSNRGRVRSLGFASDPVNITEIYCAGSNTGNKFSLTGNTLTFRLLGAIPSGYDIVDFWCGNGYSASCVNFIKAYRKSDGLFYLFVVGNNTEFQSGIGSNTIINNWTRINLHSSIIEKIIDVQTTHAEGGKAYTILQLNDGTLYFAGSNTYLIDPNLPKDIQRTNFTRIK